MPEEIEKLWQDGIAMKDAGAEIVDTSPLAAYETCAACVLM
jgi:hypothetical protein